MKLLSPRLAGVAVAAAALVAGSVTSVQAETADTRVSVRVTAGGAPQRGVDLIAEKVDEDFNGYTAYLGVSGSDGVVRPSKGSRFWGTPRTLEPGTWELAFVDHAEEHGTVFRTVTLTAGTNTLADAVMEPASTARGRLLTPSGLPLKNVDVAAMAVRGETSLGFSVAMDENGVDSSRSDGSYALHGLGRATYELTTGERLMDGWPLMSRRGKVVVTQPGTTYQVPDIRVRVQPTMSVARTKARRGVAVVRAKLLVQRFGISKPGGTIRVYEGRTLLTKVRATGATQSLRVRLPKGEHRLRIKYAGSKDVRPTAMKHLDVRVR
ncbi:hypothetical protein [Aeromicrobium sp. IC_218]|uniref:hypothetical protein n=1 Tax=Aeromicrobium sp. IC_218 TaxID=2545468 RepID=UPI00103A7687|nr:hypothetical protein [Aeromicrobium sp. IC_218]TCI98869.1 hypothetical protein E0W78_08945 [Aeromicrobium sp. IC_218]